MTIEIKQWTVTFLRISLGIVFLWFGMLKMLDLSPVANMIYDVYSFVPQPLTLKIIGSLEVIIGLGFLCNVFLHATIVLFWFQMCGVFMSFLLKPSLFFSNNNPMLITLDGEFVVKNIVLIAASILLYTVSKKKQRKIKN